MNAVEEFERTLVTTFLRKNPQPYLLSFGVRIGDVVRAFELGAGIGIPMQLYAVERGDLLFDNRCSSKLAEDLKPQNLVHIRASETNRVSDLFRNFISVFGQSGLQVHFCFRKTRLLKKKAAPNDSLLLGHNIVFSALARSAGSASLVNRVTVNNEPEVDWLLHCSEVDAIPLESTWASAPNLFWFHCFPAFVVERRMNGVVVSTDLSPRNVLLSLIEQGDCFKILFDLCTQEQGELGRPAPKRRRREALPGSGNAYQQRRTTTM